MDSYVIYGGRPGYDRLKVLARRWQDSTRTLLEEVGVGPGMRCLDLGCGAGDVTFELARRVGPTGLVVGVDFDDVQLNLTRAEARDRGLANVDFRCADVTTFKDGATYDVVYSRNVIQHVSRPVAVIARMWSHVQPGGVLVAEDVDFDFAFCKPPCAGHDFWQTRYQATLRARGGDPHSGRRLLARFLTAGTATPTISIVQHVDVAGEGKLIPYLTVEGTADTMVELGVATEAEVTTALADLRAMANDATTLCGSPLTFQARSRRPT